MKKVFVLMREGSREVGVDGTQKIWVSYVEGPYEGFENEREAQIEAARKNAHIHEYSEPAKEFKYVVKPMFLH